MPPSESKEIFSGQIELDESYFGGKRKGKRRRGAVSRRLYLLSGYLVAPI